jgi:hypothetical protein
MQIFSLETSPNETNCPLLIMKQLVRFCFVLLLSHSVELERAGDGRQTNTNDTKEDDDVSILISLQL